MHLKQAAIAKDASALALDAAHTLAFHTGLGATLYPTASTPLPSLNEASIAKFASSVYAKNNIALVADGTSSSTLARWTDQFFEDVPSTSSTAVTTTPSKYHGGESRIAHPGDNAMVIAFPGFAYTAPKAELAVLAALLGGESSIKWTPGFTLLAKATAGTTGLSAKAKALSYSDAGLLTVTLSGPAAAVKKAAEDTVAALKSVAAGTVSKEDLTKAIAKAKFDSLDETQLTSTGLALAGSTILHTGKALQPLEAIKGVESVTADKLKAVSRYSNPTSLMVHCTNASQAAKALLDGKATVATVGDLHVLPFAEDLGLKV